MNTRQYNILILGDSQVGKTTWLKRHETGEYTKFHVPTVNSTITTLDFATNVGTIILKCSEGVVDNTEYDGCVLMFSVTDRKSYTHLDDYLQIAKAYTNNILVCGNKVDDKTRTVASKNMMFHRKHKLVYHEISARSNYNFEKPFGSLIKMWLGNDVIFIDNEQLEPPTVDSAYIAAIAIANNNKY